MCFVSVPEQDYKHGCKGLKLWTLLTGSVSHILLDVNSSLNFFLYCVMSATFRTELTKLIGQRLGGRMQLCKLNRRGGSGEEEGRDEGEKLTLGQGRGKGKGQQRRKRAKSDQVSQCLLHFRAARVCLSCSDGFHLKSSSQKKVHVDSSNLLVHNDWPVRTNPSTSSCESVLLKSTPH
jgi:hypothetical protein